MKIRLITTALLLPLLSGCVAFDMNQSLALTNSEAGAFTRGNLQLQTTARQREQALIRANDLLSTELEQEGAVELALLNSPAVQAMLAAYWADSSSTALEGSIPNPVFNFARLESDSELELERLLSIGLLDLIRLPMLLDRADRQLQAKQIELTGQVVDLVTSVRQAWVNAVSSQQLSDYGDQVLSSAEASATLAAGMESIGNFNALTRARQQSFYADAATNLALARHNAVASREALVRILGLSESQSMQLKLPKRLPDLPDTPVSTNQILSIAPGTRLDIRLAQAQLQSVTSQQGIQLLGEITDVELAGIRNTVSADGENETISGYELGFELPIFSNISQVRNKLNARSLAAANNLESIARSAVSHIRESYSAYRTSFDIAKHYRDEVVPLQELVSEENVLNYNGMIIGVFELLADSRTQIETVQSSIEAATQFWLSDAALRASMTGQATTISVAMAGGEGGGGDAEH